MSDEACDWAVDSTMSIEEMVSWSQLKDINGDMKATQKAISKV